MSTLYRIYVRDKIQQRYCAMNLWAGIPAYRLADATLVTLAEGEEALAKLSAEYPHCSFQLRKA